MAPRYTVEDRDAERVIIATDDQAAALAVALELGERDGLHIVLTDDEEDREIWVSLFRAAYDQAKAEGFGLEAMGCAPLLRGDVMNQERGTDAYDPAAVYDSESGEAVPGWREAVRSWF